MSHNTCSNYLQVHFTPTEAKAPIRGIQLPGFGATSHSGVVYTVTVPSTPGGGTLTPVGHLSYVSVYTAHDNGSCESGKTGAST